MALLRQRFLFRGFVMQPWGRLVALLVLSLGVWLPTARAATTEYELKAVFLLNFTRFVEWPEDIMPPGKDALIIGVIGVDPFGEALDTAVRNEAVNGRPLIVKRFQRKEEVTVCHVLFVSRSETPRLKSILDAVKGKAILTVSDIERFAYSGGIIGLVMDQGKVKIQINVEQAKHAQLNLSSKLLGPAQLVTRDGSDVFFIKRPKGQLFSRLEFVGGSRLREITLL